MSEATGIKRATPVIIVDAIEPCLEFWIEGLGFENTMEVPGDDGLDFVGLAKDGVEIMYQVRSSIDNDAPGVAALINDPASFLLFVEVESLDAAAARLEGYERLVEERTTFYGSREIGYTAPCGTPVVLAEFGDP